MEIKEILNKSLSKRSFTNGIHSLLNWADARESADIIYYICDAYRLFAGQALLMTSKMSHTEYLIPTDNILVFDWCFNLTNKSNLIGRL